MPQTVSNPFATSQSDDSLSESLFLGALDCGAAAITKEVESAVVHRPRWPWPPSRTSVSRGLTLRWRHSIHRHSTRPAVRIAPARAAAVATSGVAARPIADLAAYAEALARRLGATVEGLATSIAT